MVNPLKRASKRKPPKKTTLPRRPKTGRPPAPAEAGRFKFVLSWLGAVLDFRGRGLTVPATVIIGVVAVCLTLAFARATSFR